jgi:hypothetical protein
MTSQGSDFRFTIAGMRRYGFDNSLEPPAINLEKMPGPALSLANYLITGLIVLVIIIMPLYGRDTLMIIVVNSIKGDIF